MKFTPAQEIGLLVSGVLIIGLLVGLRYIIRRQRRIVRDDLEQRGLMPSRKHRRHRHHHHEHHEAHEHHHDHHDETPREEKRNPTLAERGGLPPIRTGLPNLPNGK